MLDIRSALCIVLLAACTPRGEAADDPGSATPVPDPSPGPEGSGLPEAPPGREGPGGLPPSQHLPVRADQAPLVLIREALEVDSLLHRRVRVAGRCTAAGAGPRAGSWTLEEAGSSIEVRGLVPSWCGIQSGANLTIFAQIEPKAAGSPDRLLLRLPD